MKYPIPLSLIVAIGSVAITFSFLSFSLPASSQSAPFGNSLVPHSFASHFPLEVETIYPQKTTGGDATLGLSVFNVIDNVIDTPNSCEFCTLVVYNGGPHGYADLSYKDIRAHDLTGVKKLSFYIMGINGGEVVDFNVAGKQLSSDAGQSSLSNVKFAVNTGDVTLDKNWKKINIDLSRTDMTGITVPLNIHVLHPSSPGKVSFYVKYPLLS